jgi:hypothetical protein
MILSTACHDFHGVKSIGEVQLGEAMYIISEEVTLHLLELKGDQNIRPERGGFMRILMKGEDVAIWPRCTNPRGLYRHIGHHH